ncbi:MAG: glycosyltransferase [Tannerellaceae bacterium]|jgi:cellulose synthase/poly-beta-1,6-N-acetylglucosamine synthase-like glycosyltransferase|nr:glycosyltransferase [Tannerellaceae bacterium]
MAGFDCGMKLAPIVIFAYNRPLHLRQTVEALLKNDYASESDLIVYSDGYKDEKSREGVEKTREYIRSVTGFKSLKVVEREKNWGLANNIIDGVTTLVNTYGRIIVLEDDLLTSPYFLKFMNEGLNFYEHNEEVISIHGYIYPVKAILPETFLIKGADCLGWGTWKRGWDLFEPDGSKLLSELILRRRIKEFDFEGSYPYTKMLKKQVEGKVGSWAIRWYASAFLNDKLTLYPGRSLIFHNGSDGSGTNCGVSDEFEVELSTTPIHIDLIEIKESLVARKMYIQYLRYTMRKSRVKAFFKKIFSK